MAYESSATFAQSWGLIYFAVLFAGVLIYALAPGNQRKFDEAARLPLEEDEP